MLICTIIPYNIIMIIFMSAAKFTFPTIVSYSALGSGLYLFYRKKIFIIAQFKNYKRNKI